MAASAGVRSSQELSRRQPCMGFLREEFVRVEISRGIGKISSQTQGLVEFHAQGLAGLGRFSNPEVGLDLYPTHNI